jgi:hypothetical protein
MRNELRDYLKNREFDKIRKPSLAMQFLYDADEFYRFRGAEALGVLCKGETARNFILRLFWHLSDESGAYCIGAPLGIAEIGRSNPKEFEGFKNKFVSLLDDWEVERRYVAYGIGRIAEIVADAYPNPAEKLLEVMDELKNPDFLVYAIWALGELRAVEAVDVITKFVDDDSTARFYDGEGIKVVRIGDMARRVLESLITSKHPV